MSARFDLYYETPALCEQIEPVLSSIPPYFDLHQCEGTCELKYHSSPDWQSFPFPVPEMTIYIFSGEGKNLKYAGGNYGGSVSVKILSKEISSPKKIALRVWHEMLHAVGQPADDMNVHAPEWTTSALMLFFFQFCAIFGLENNAYFHQPFYQWLTDRAKESE